MNPCFGKSQNMLPIMSQIVILFSLILVGYFCKKIKLITNDMNQDVSNLLVYIAVPATIIVSLSGLTFSRELLVECLQLLAMSFCIYLLFILLSFIFVRVMGVEGTTRDIFQFGLIFGNTTFIGFPMAQAVFGQQGLFFMAVYEVMFPVFAWTYGVVIMRRPFTESAKEAGDVFSGLGMLKQIVNPSILAVGIGFFLLAFSLKLPEAIDKSLQLLGDLTIPLAMIFIGSVLGDMEVGTILKDAKVIVCSLQRLILLPFIVFGLLRLFHFDGYLAGIPVLYASMPVATMTSIFAAKYGNDYYLASRLIFISTLLSIVTIPLVVWVLLR